MDNEKAKMLTGQPYKVFGDVPLYYGEDYWIVKITDFPCQSNVLIGTADITPSNVRFIVSNIISLYSKLLSLKKLLLMQVKV